MKAAHYNIGTEVGQKPLCSEMQVSVELPHLLSRSYAVNASSVVTNKTAAKPLLYALVWFFEVGAVLLTTLGVALIYLPRIPVKHHDIATAAFVWVLTFCLIRRNPGAVGVGRVCNCRKQLRRTLHLTPNLLFSALAGTFVLALLGHKWPLLLAAMSVWLASCFAALMTAGSVGSYASRHPCVSRRVARNVAVIGHEANALHIAELCLGSAGETVRLVGIFSDVTRSSVASVTGSVADLIALSCETSIDDVIIAIPPAETAFETVRQIQWRLRGVAVAIYMLPYLAQRAEVAPPIEMFGSIALMVVQRRPLTFYQAIYKRLFDVALALMMITMLSPVFAAVALAVKLDSPGPVLFRQPRLGLNDRPFTVLKFRSMYAKSSDMMAAQQTSRFDPRVTRVGRWLRKFSLDELPQFFNVLAGDMSLVGPRPHAPHTRAGGRLLRDAMAEYVIRHQVKPGITGWAQVNGARGELVTMDDLHRRVKYDLEYIRSWSLWFDMRIISMTVLREVFSKHAF